MLSELKINGYKSLHPPSIMHAGVADHNSPYIPVETFRRIVFYPSSSRTVFSARSYSSSAISRSRSTPIMKEDSDVVDSSASIQVMATKKIIAICQSKGEFLTNKDGTLSYSGGEAYAMDLNEETSFDYFKKEVAEMFGCSADTMIVKYFLPSNKKTPITISKDKDLQRMISFVGDSQSVDVFILSEDESARNVSNNMPTSRSSRTTESEICPLMEVGPVDIVYHTIEVHNEPPLSSVPMAMTPSDESHRRAATQWENMITGIDQRFSSFVEFKEALHKYSIAHGFAYRYKKNDSHRVSVKCKGQGCPWRIYASRLSTTQLIAIKKMNPTHTCDGVNVKAGYRATRGWVGSIIKDKLKESPHYKPKDIAEDILKEYGIQLNYSQAWRAKEIAREQLQGSYKEAYKLLPLFCEKIKEINPGSFANFYTKEDSSFHRLFVSFHASISGFQQGCRQLLFLDNVHLLSKYPGVLLAAISADGDDGIFPVAFAVVDAESEENWYWFLQELKIAISPNPEQQMTFVADFQKGLKNSIAEIFPNAFHAYCLRSLAEKLNQDLQGQFSHEARRFMMNDLYDAAYATKIDGFQNAVNSIKSISPEACNWVLQSEPQHWANAFFPGARYNHMLSNFGQDFYSWVAEAQELPITQLIDGLRGKLMETMYTRRVESSQWITRLTPSKEEQLQKEALSSQTLHVQISETNKFEVHGESVLEVVDLETPDCTCKDWTLTGIPCAHAVAVIDGISSDMIDSRGIYEYCSRYFTTEMYQLSYGESINPIPNVELAEGNGSLELAVMVTPPPTRRPPGRPKLKPSDPVDIIKRQLQCSKCKGLGHNKKTCKAT